MRGKAEAQRFLEQTLRDVEARHNGALRRQDLPTLGSLVDEYIMRQTAEANTLRILADCLHYATEGPELDGKGGWEEVRIDRLTLAGIGAWRKRLPRAFGLGDHEGAQAALSYAVRGKLLDKSPAALVPNPAPKRREVPAFASVDELEAVAAELGPAVRSIPVFCALTGLRPEKWRALHKSDVDRSARLVTASVYVWQPLTRRQDRRQLRSAHGATRGNRRREHADGPRALRRGRAARALARLDGGGPDRR